MNLNSSSMRIEFLESGKSFPKVPLCVLTCPCALALASLRIVRYMVFWSQWSKLSLDKPCSPYHCFCCDSACLFFPHFSVCKSYRADGLRQRDGWSPYLRAPQTLSKHWVLFWAPERWHSDKTEGVQEASGWVGLEEMLLSPGEGMDLGHTTASWLWLVERGLTMGISWS